MLSRWTQYCVAMIDAGVLVLLMFTFEETLFPRFIFEKIQGVLPVTEGRVSPVESTTDDKDAIKKDLNRVTTIQSESHNIQQRDFPRRTYTQKLKLWVYFPEDRTTYLQYLRRPFSLFLFPNVVISGCIFAFGCTGKLNFIIFLTCMLIIDSWYRVFQYHLGDLDGTAVQLEHLFYRSCLPCCAGWQLCRLAYRSSVGPDCDSSLTQKWRCEGA